MAFLFSLSTVLAFRRQKEQAEERLLLHLGLQMQQAEADIGRISVDIARSTEERAREIQQTFNAAHHQTHYARYQLLQNGRSELQTQLSTLRTRHGQQQAIYLASRRDREMLSDLEAKQRRAYRVELDRAETKRNDDLYLSRRLRS